MTEDKPGSAGSAGSGGSEESIESTGTGEAPGAKEGHLEAKSPGAPGPDPNRLTPAWARFRSCRWRADPEDGEFCTHRDVLPYAGKEGFNPESWCPDCPYFKLKRVARKPSY